MSNLAAEGPRGHRLQQERQAQALLLREVRRVEPDGHGRFGTLFFSEGVTGTLDVPTAEATFRQPAFNQMSVFKLVIVHVLLQSARVNVWFSDVDIVFVADPWPAFRHRQACDYEFQPNSRDYDGAGEGNTGFHKFKSSAPPA